MWFQSPEYLKWSRQQMLTDENINTIVTKLGLNGTMSILEVGCGSGELTRLLAERLNCVITAIDNDPGLIQYAENVYSPNVNFVCCDALALPFSDSSFDVVISHTFLTSMPRLKSISFLVKASSSPRRRPAQYRTSKA